MACPVDASITLFEPGTPSSVSFEVMGPEAGCSTPDFVRGEVNGDGLVDVADAQYILNHLFADGPAPTVEEAGDVNGDINIDIADPVFLLNYLFNSGPPPPFPFPDPGCV